ncbi:hypothetical protein J421_5326 (plasmid) [Gemmatirosa kalamazoonensis]|uniref:Uncharacterized protein n=1 Tax=Gemmatirosa kalamazoonensis TaxID=861299 RepID=W0RQ77_9BACT|nr:hypothetical protein J421_5326 [Gemmatirosa kalamazoonensis]
MQRVVPLYRLVAILLAASACGTEAGPDAPDVRPLPRSAATLAGPVVACDTGARPRLLVQGRAPLPPIQTGRTWLGVSASTVLLHRDGSRAALSEFGVGATLRAWISGDFVVTDPGQAIADTLVLDGAAATSTP